MGHQPCGIEVNTAQLYIKGILTPDQISTASELYGAFSCPLKQWEELEEWMTASQANFRLIEAIYKYTPTRSALYSKRPPFSVWWNTTSQNSCIGFFKPVQKGNDLYEQTNF
jgi:hypothetical protein